SKGERLISSTPTSPWLAGSPNGGVSQRMPRATGCRWRIMRSRCFPCISWRQRPRVCILNTFRLSAIRWEPTSPPWPRPCDRAGSSCLKPPVLVLKWTKRLCSAIALSAERYRRGVWPQTLAGLSPRERGHRPMHLRLALPEDREAIMALIDAVYREYGDRL